MAAGFLSLFLDLAAKNTFRIAGKDFRIAGKEDIATSYHCRSKSHIVFEAKTISLSKQKPDHFRSKKQIIFEAKTISCSKQKPYHVQSKTISFSKQNHIISVATSYRSIFTVPYSKGYLSGQSRGLVGDYDSGKGHGILYIVNLAKIMAWLWYEVGQEDGHEFGRDYGQDIYNIIFHGHDNFQ